MPATSSGSSDGWTFLSGPSGDKGWKTLALVYLQIIWQQVCKALVAYVILIARISWCEGSTCEELHHARQEPSSRWRIWHFETSRFSVCDQKWLAILAAEHLRGSDVAVIPAQLLSQGYSSLMPAGHSKYCENLDFGCYIKHILIAKFVSPWKQIDEALYFGQDAHTWTHVEGVEKGRIGDQFKPESSAGHWSQMAISDWMASLIFQFVAK